ncbi:MAG: PAS domain S-box protein [Methylococcales bacterium]|nr:PAS domain S-box protein [Methylococcales bacterium]
MTTPAIEKQDAETLRTKAEQLLIDHQNDVRKRAESLMSKSGADIARMSTLDIEKMLFEFQVHQIELELQNEELTRTQQELSDSRDDFARIYNLSPVAYLTLNGQGVIKKANIAATRLLGESKESLAGKKLAKFIHPSDQDNYYFFIHDLVEEKNTRILNAKLAVKNGESIHPECPGFGLCDCTPALCSQNELFTYLELRGIVNYTPKNEFEICLAIQDITEYKHTQETISCLNSKLEKKILEQTSTLVEVNMDLTRKITELKESKRQLLERETRINAIFNASIEGIVTIDTSGIILSANAAVKAIFGYSEEELVGCSFNKLLSPSQSKKQGYDVVSYLQAKIPSIIGMIREVDGIRKDGTVVPLDVSLVEFSIDGTQYYTGIVRDVSLRKYQEQKDKDHLEELAHVTRLCLIGEMGSGIAHEVNQPLTAIVNYTQACLRFIGADKTDFDQLGEILFKIHQQALKAGQIIHRMKDFVSNRKIFRTETDINSVLEDAISLCANDLKQGNVILELDLAKNIPKITVDDVQIEQVILNLIRNSIDALTVTTQNKPRRLRIQSYMKKRDLVEIKVCDNGQGIDDAQKAKILTPFFTTKPTGMGMGLSISRSIVEAHQGVFSFSSNPDEGTVFSFTLPVKIK